LHRYGSVYAKHSKYMILLCMSRELPCHVSYTL
jgi:hypothetical protein